MSVFDVIQNSLIYYDRAAPVIQYLKQNTYMQGNRTGNDWQRTNIKFLDKITSEVLIDTDVETLAIYYDKLDVWAWAWSLIGLTNAENFLSKEILNYVFKLDSNMAYLKSILSTSRGIIKHQEQIDINLAIGANIIKKPYIYPFELTIEDHTLIYYLILIDTDQLDKFAKKIDENMINIESDSNSNESTNIV